TANQGNFYSYPVLGQCTDSPGAQPQNGCPADKTPVLVQFGGPDNVYYVDLANGRALEWYQPVHEPGNIFSYPGSLTQLQEDQPQQQTPDGQPTGSSLQLLSPSNVLWDPQANEQVAINWTSGGGTDVSSGSTDTHSLDTSETVSGSKTFFGGVARVSASFEF